VVERRSLRSERSHDLQLMGSLTIYRPMGKRPMGKPSAVGQLTRPTRPFIFSESINAVVKVRGQEGLSPLQALLRFGPPDVQSFFIYA